MAVKGGANRLMAQADTKDRDLPAKALDDVDRNARFGG